MSAATKRFSVIIPTYNYASTLPRAVESVVAQLGTESELIVVDDGSTDHTPEIVAALGSRFPGAFRSVRKENGGSASARNAGIELALGEYLIFLDADDELHPEALSLLSSHVRKQPTTRFVAGGHISVTPGGVSKEHRPGLMPEQPYRRVKAYLLDKSLSLANGACAMHRDVFSKARYPEAFRSAEDVPVFAQVLGNEPCSVIDEPLALIHKHDDSLRHHIGHAKAGGVALVDEVFAPQRLGADFQSLKQLFYVQRCLSLFRSAYLSGDDQAAKGYYSDAFRARKRILLDWSYTSKALRVWLGFRR